MLFSVPTTHAAESQDTVTSQEDNTVVTSQYEIKTSHHKLMTSQDGDDVVTSQIDNKGIHHIMTSQLPPLHADPFAMTTEGSGVSLRVGTDARFVLLALCGSLCGLVVVVGALYLYLTCTGQLGSRDREVTSHTGVMAQGSDGGQHSTGQVGSLYVFYRV